jgi:CheY-like chemotaxis protein
MKVLAVVTMTTKTILLIHQQPTIQEVFQACLTDLGGWKVQAANSTLEGLRQAKTYQPDAIILDASIGEIDGLRFLQQLRAQPKTKEIPVVFLVHNTKWLDLQQSWFRLFQIGAVIVDPLNPGMLSPEIANVLGWNLES